MENSQGIHKRLPQYDAVLMQIAHKLLDNANLSLDGNWHFFCVNQNRGRCYYRKQIITIPIWVLRRAKKQIGYAHWYIAHELSHIFAGYNANHGPEFMYHLKQICPPDYWHYETSYKPQNAQAAGISKDQSINKLKFD